MKERLVRLLVLPVLVVVAPLALAVGILRVAGIDVVETIRTLPASAGLPPGVVELFDVLQFPIYLLFIAVVYFLAWLVSRISTNLAEWVLVLTRFDAGRRDIGPPADTAGRPLQLERRRETIRSLVAGLISLTAYVAATILALSQFFSFANLAIISTILANAFGFAARDYIGDLLNGFSNIFEDRFSVGDNIAVFRTGDKVEGVVEKVTVRTLSLRTRAGELINVPQGEVRIIRNYTRGSFTGTSIICRVAAVDLPLAMAQLQALGEAAPGLLPDLIEPWTLVAQEGIVSNTTEIIVYAKARYGHGSGLRLRMMMLVEEKLSEAGIALAA